MLQRLYSINNATDTCSSKNTLSTAPRWHPVLPLACTRTQVACSTPATPRSAILSKLLLPSSMLAGLRSR